VPAEQVNADMDNPEEEELHFTEAHQDALRQAGDILDKFFDGYVLAVRILDYSGKKELTGHKYNGGISQAVGLCEITKTSIVRETLTGY
jgi:hypothetical protein